MEEKTLDPDLLADLVRQAQTGDRAAAEALYRQTWPALWRTVRALAKNDADANDLIQQTWVTALPRLNRLRKPERVLPWLKKIAVNEYRQTLRRSKTLELTALDEDAVSEEAADGPQQLLERREQADALRAMIDALPEGQRAVMVLYYCEQYSIREIAKQLGVSVGTVKAQLHHGRKKLEARWTAGGGTAGLAVLLPRWQATLKAAAKPALDLLPETAVLHTKSAALVLLGRAAITVAVAAAVGGIGFGVTRLARQTPVGDYRPPAPTLVTAPATTEPAVVSEPAVDPKPAPQETELLLPPREKPPRPAPETTEATEPAPPETTAPVWTVPAYPFTYQAVTGRLGQDWIGSFRTDQEWHVRLDSSASGNPYFYVPPEVASSHVPGSYNSVTSVWSDGAQIVTIHLAEAGTYTWSVSKDGDVWVPWVTITITE